MTRDSIVTRLEKTVADRVFGMQSDRTTSEKRLKAKNDYQRYLGAVLKAASGTYDHLDEKERAAAVKAVYRINRIRHGLYEKAVELGYVKRCIEAMPGCRWQCCKWHFPKSLGEVDLFMMVCSLGSEERKALEEKLALDTGTYECPFLAKKGCLLPFDRRPLACANAYPCFLGEPYYRFLQKQRHALSLQLMWLSEMLARSGAREGREGNHVCR
ncbi:MAG: hypothetical protein SWE60_19005 [Thermodesulfobacteriota bacterium]|nr:hypothetical protein [Thermodesulfobacteriota bacterium]